MASASDIAVARTADDDSTPALTPVVLAYLLGLVVMHVGYWIGSTSLTLFTVLYLLLLLIAFPRRMVAPSSMLFFYYGMWFVLSPHFAHRFAEADFTGPVYSLALAFAFSLMGAALIGLMMGEKFALSSMRQPQRISAPPAPPPMAVVAVLFAMASLFVVLIIMASGGLQRWIEDPGDAFLNRAGSGVFVVASHFTSQALAALVGFVSYVHRKRWLLSIFLVWVLLTSPVHGSKLQISLLVLLSLLPWLRRLRPLSSFSLLVAVALTVIFVFGLYLRNMKWITADEMLPYALGYFAGLDLLALAIVDFPSSLLTTFHYPFRKFLTPIGLSDPQLYFDLNHMLTDFYFPKSWEIRATEQWPLETDLYLNFYFYGGLPLVGLYTFVVGWVYGAARARDSLGLWFASLMLTVGLLSHLRGTLFNHVDFYLYPYIIITAVILARFSLERRIPVGNMPTPGQTDPAEP